MRVTVDPEFQSRIPPMRSEELANLEENIRSDGCREPLVVLDGVILDGHHRYEICTRLGIPFEVVEAACPDREAALDWIDRNQLGRRNRSPDQMSLLRGRRYNSAKRQGARSDLTSPQNEEKLTTAESLGREHGVSRATIERDGSFAENVEALERLHPGTERLVTAGSVTKKDIKAAALLEDRPELVKEVLSQRDKTMTQVLREILAEEARANMTPIPDGKYRVLYADPPWKYGDLLAISKDGLSESYGAADAHYPQMSIDELCALPIKDLAADNSVLFLWTTVPMTEDAYKVARAWGFVAKTEFVWDKIKHNMGHYNSVRHEKLLVCTRGSCLPDVKKLIDSVQSIERGEHSEKPEEFRQIIDTIYPQGPRIELFARKKAPGWKTWGTL